MYTALLNFAGDEIYIADVPPQLVGKPFGDALLGYDNSAIIGLQRADGSTRLNPPMDEPIESSDRLIAISADDNTIRPTDRPVEDVRGDLVTPRAPGARAPERTLVLAWNRRAPLIIRTLDGYVPPGSRIVVVANYHEVERVLARVRASLVNQSLDVRDGDPTDRAALFNVCAEGFDHVIVLAQDDDDPQTSDAQTLITLFHLREIEGELPDGFSITSEMLDLRNRELARVTRADDFIVSDQVASLLLSQLSGNRHLKDVFDDLFQPEGSEIYLRPVNEYVVVRQPMTFATVVESARRRGEIAIGYRQSAHHEDVSRAYGVVINPSKSASLVLEDDHRVIVLGEKG